MTLFCLTRCRSYQRLKFSASITTLIFADSVWMTKPLMQIRSDPTFKLSILPHLSLPTNVLWCSHLLPGLLQLPLWSHSKQPYKSSGTPQRALPSASPDSPLFSPSYTPSWNSLDWIQNHAHGSQSCERIHSTHERFTYTGLHTNPCHFPVTSGHWACHLPSLPLWQ